jgi:hypothetical protein
MNQKSHNATTTIALCLALSGGAISATAQDLECSKDEPCTMELTVVPAGPGGDQIGFHLLEGDTLTLYFDGKKTTLTWHATNWDDVADEFPDEKLKGKKVDPVSHWIPDEDLPGGGTLVTGWEFDMKVKDSHGHDGQNRNHEELLLFKYPGSDEGQWVINYGKHKDGGGQLHGGTAHMTQ